MQKSNKFALILSFFIVVSFVFIGLHKSAKTVKSQTTHVVISEIQIAGDGSVPASDEFVELYNPKDEPVVMESWKLTRKNSSHSEANLVTTLDGTIPAHGYFLIGHGTGYNGAVALDVPYSAGSNALTNNYSVLLYDDLDNLVDKVGFGTPNDLEDDNIPGYENTPFPSNPVDNGSIERKPGAGDSTGGNGEDTDNNANDFNSREVSEPQNTQSNPEPPVVITPTEAVPTETVTPIPTGATPTNGPTDVPTVIPTETPTATPIPTLTPTPEPTPTEIIIGYLGLGKNAKVCTLNYKVVGRGFFRFLMPTVKCVKAVN